MLTREDDTPSGGILCDEMGLGKTIQMLGLMKESPKKTLLVGPLSVLTQWEEAAKRCGFPVWKTHPTKSEWLCVTEEGQGPNLYLINYERASYRKQLVSELWPRIIYDEAHRLGNSKTRCFKTASDIQAEHKWFLTATPITNKLENLMALLRLLGYEKLKPSLQSLEPILSTSLLCRKMSDLRDAIPSLPQAATCIKHSLDFDSEEEAEFYRGIQGILQRRFRMLETESAGKGEYFRLIMRLRQISLHPQVYIAARKRQWRNYERDDFLNPSTKFNKLTDLIKAECEENHRWLIFCHFHEEMQLLQEHLLDCPVVRECGIYSGHLSAEERMEVIKTSKEPLAGCQQEVLLVQLQAGGVGLNLQHFDRVVFVGPWWTAAIMDQAIGRAVRIGQTKKVVVHHLILKEEETFNIDKMMLEKAESKRDLCEKILGLAAGQQKETLGRE
jgi:SNF2 family DNA or RNA helicase